MPGYKIEYIGSGFYSALVVSLTYRNILNELDNIEEELKLNKISGMIVIDNLLKSGNNEERFIEAFFDGRKFDRKSFKFVEISRNNSVRKLSCSLLKHQEGINEVFALNKFQKDLLFKGLSI